MTAASDPGTAADAKALRQDMLDWLVQQEVAALTKNLSASVRPATWLSSRPPIRDVSLRAAILASEKRWQEALEVVQPPVKCDVGTLQAIALHLPRKQGDAVIDLFLRIFDVQMSRASSPYTSVLDLVTEIADRMDAVRRRNWLLHLRVTYKAKRNFVGGLPEA